MRKSSYLARTGLAEKEKKSGLRRRRRSVRPGQKRSLGRHKGFSSSPHSSFPLPPLLLPKKGRKPPPRNFGRKRTGGRTNHHLQTHLMQGGGNLPSPCPFTPSFPEKKVEGGATSKSFAIILALSSSSAPARKRQEEKEERKSVSSLGI